MLVAQRQAAVDGGQSLSTQVVYVQLDHEFHRQLVEPRGEQLRASGAGHWGCYGLEYAESEVRNSAARYIKESINAEVREPA